MDALYSIFIIQCVCLYNFTYFFNTTHFRADLEHLQKQAVIFVLPSIFSNTNLIIWILLFIVTLLFILLIITMRVTFFNNRKIKRILKNCSNGKLDEAIVLYYNKVDKLSEEIHQRFSELENIERAAMASRLKIGYLRYDAFDNMSNELSYSFVILDEKDSGFVVSGIFGRETTNTYLKPVVQGKSTITLSDEEKRVIDYARQSYKNKLE